MDERRAMSRVYKRGKAWYIDYSSYKGRRIRKRIGKDRKIAELTLHDIELKIERGENLGIHETKKVLLEDFAEEYLKFAKANKAESSYGRDIISLRIHLIPYFEGKYLHEVATQEIERYKELRLEEVKPATVNRELACLKHFYSKAVEWGYVDKNPVKNVKLLKEPPGRVRYLKPWEIRALLRECSPRIKPVVLVTLNTGMRKSEVLNLTWHDVNFDERTIMVRNSKNNESRIIPMNATVYKELKTLYMKASSSCVFSENGKSYRSVREGFNNAVKRARIKDFRFHDLRHCFASYLAMSGCNLKTIQELLGHKDIKMTMRYSHLSKEHLQEAVNLLSEKMSRVGTNLAQKKRANISSDANA